jgi:hypothetical protein
MASSFLICYPDVPVNALVTSASATYDTDYPFWNTFTGARSGYAQLAASNTTVTLTYDLGTGNSRTIDHFILGGVKLLKANGVTQAVVRGSNDNVTYFNVLGTSGSFQSRTFDGPDDSDIIFTTSYNDTYGNTPAAYRYYQVVLAGGTHTFPVSKIYFGAAFDMGKEPDMYEPEYMTEQDADTWRYQRGNILMTRAFYPRLKLTVEWDAVTDAKAAEFETSILKNPFRDSVFLYAATYNDPLYDNKLLHCRVLSEECSVERKKQDWATVKAVFEELV